MLMIKIRHYCSFLAVLGLFFTSCSPLQQVSPSSMAPTFTVLPSNTPPALEKPTASPVLSPSATTTPIPLPPSPTLQPSLDEANTKEIILELLKTNGSCKLPCFWGITPGETTLDEAKRFFDHLGWTGDDYQAFIPPDETFYETGRDVDGHGIGIMIYPQNGLAETIHSGFGGRNFKTLMPYYTIEQVLSSEGVPSQVYVSLATGLEVSTPKITDYNLDVFYQESQILVIYGGSAIKIGDAYKICPGNPNQGNPNVPEDEGSISLFLGVPGNELTPEELMNPFGQFGSPLTIDKVFGISPEEFYKKMTQSKEPACFLTPRSIWP